MHAASDIGSTPMALARTWRAKIHEGRLDDYMAFLEERSYPMFKSLPGCLGVVFLRDGLAVTVVSVWEDAAAVDALETNRLYNDTVEELERREILASPDPATVHGCDGLIARP